MGKGTAVRGSGNIKTATVVKCCNEEPSGKGAEARQAHRQRRAGVTAFLKAGRNYYRGITGKTKLGKGSAKLG